ncbi:malonyl-CoA-acyl carrier protein transacylase, mitochondrial isoform X1 [Electrophorus electricus]|uniref:malonyl-CoA-acyl carrier protein transacylase, mitochondrial isoform X1 n=1 Tax=Electrophorus electricus TaxID=8005 RepID=UPI0015D091A4|nr:malonyl-CoA-acyl carrier protein transacylase, mitochondrial isoform X1 [Electrophorus electricus]
MGLSGLVSFRVVARSFYRKTTVFHSRKVSDCAQTSAQTPLSPDNRNETAEDERRKPRRPPNKVSVLLFPGQGSQFVGMGRGMLKYDNVKEMFAVAQKVLGYDLLSLCLNGPEDDLMKTVHCQPAVFVTSLAAVERLNHGNPAAIENCVGAAGFSVGEFAALVFSGAMDFAEALFAVKVRAEAMQKASDQTPSGMLSVIGRTQANYKHACLQAREHCLSLGIENPVCSIANYLFPDGRVIAGHLEVRAILYQLYRMLFSLKGILGEAMLSLALSLGSDHPSLPQALNFLQKNSRKLHFARTRLLPVSGAFHTALMEPAVEPLRDVLRQLQVSQPKIAVHSNVDGKRYAHDGHVRRQLARQLVSPVKWEQTLHEIYQRAQGHGFPQTYEVGPGRQLGFTLQKCNMKAFQNYTHVGVDVPEDE